MAGAISISGRLGALSTSTRCSLLKGSTVGHDPALSSSLVKILRELTTTPPQAVTGYRPSLDKGYVAIVLGTIEAEEGKFV